MMQAIILWVLAHLNYWVVLLFMAIESSFIPFPSEVVVPPAAWLSCMGHNGMNLVLVVLFATAGADIGALVNYFLARYLGRPLIYGLARTRLAHSLLITEEKVAQSEEYFRKHGAASTFFGRLVPAVRQLISIPAGLSGMRISTFLIYTTLGALLWNTVLALIGFFIYKFAGLTDPAEVAELAKHYSHEIGYAILLLILIALGIMIYKGRK